MSTIRTAACVVLVAVVAACRAHVPEGPPPPRAGIDVCSGCGMVFSDTRAGAAVRASEDDRTGWLLFDDVDCLRRWEAGHPEIASRPAYVRDHARERWIEAGTASLVRADAPLTPMGSGLIAFASGEDAQAFVREHGGAAVRWDEALSPSEVHR